MKHFNPKPGLIMLPVFLIMALWLTALTPSARAAESSTASCQTIAGTPRIVCQTDNPVMAQRLSEKASASGMKFCRAAVDLTKNVVVIVFPVQWAKVLINTSYSLAVDLGWVDSLCEFLKWLFDGGQTVEATPRIPAPTTSVGQRSDTSASTPAPAQNTSFSPSQPATSQWTNMSSTTATTAQQKPTQSDMPQCGCARADGWGAYGYSSTVTPGGYGQYRVPYSYGNYRSYGYGVYGYATRRYYGYGYTAPRYYTYYGVPRHYGFRHR